MSARVAAAVQGVKRYFTGKSCPKGHVAERFVSNGECLDCNTAYREANREETRKRIVRHYRENRTARLAYRVAYAALNREKRLAQGAVWRTENKERHRAMRASWRLNNLGRVAALTQKRNAAKLQRTPAWANLDEIREVYELAAEMSEKMGEPMHVDHEIPLQGSNVSGLHVYANLQILSGAENVRKSNKFEVA